MSILRDLREGTQLLFLYEVTANRHTRLRTIAEQLEMTVQGASDYAHSLEEEGLLVISEGEYRATKKGFEFLQLRYRELKSILERIGGALAFVETTAAIAGSAIRKGDRVGLFMEGGFLFGYAGRTSPSMGLAVQGAAKAEDFAVRDLTGIVDLRPGRIVIARVPSIPEGGTRKIPAGLVKRIRQQHRDSAVAAQDVAGVSAARKLGLRPRIEFGIPQSVIEAAERGLSVLLLVPEERAAETVQAIESMNARLEDKIPYESLSLG